MADERTPLQAALGATSYEVSSGEEYPYQTPRNRKLKQFQCCICTSLISAFVCSLIIGVSYTFLNPSIYPIANVTNLDALNDTNFNSTSINTTAILALLNLPLEDEPEVPWSGPNITQNDQDSAVQEGKNALADKEILEENMQPPPVMSPTFKHQKAMATSLEARQLAKQGFIEDHATKTIVKRHGNKTNIKENKKGRWNIGQGSEISLFKEPLSKTKSVCDFNARYRTANGTCNNKEHPFTYGVVNTPFRRAIQSDYADGISTPRCDINGKQLPSAREVSLDVHRPTYQTDPHFTVMLAVWGQFLDHDITATALNQGQNGEPIECCNGNHNLTRHPECFPVEIGPEDPFYKQYRVTCMNFVRSAPARKGKLGPREQMNQASAFIDGSVVYGTTDEKQRQLRTMEGGKLKMLLRSDGRTLLPTSTDSNDGCNRDEMGAKGRYCFDSGDARANENLHLTSMHLIWARHHNNIVDNLAKLNPHWDDERLYQEGRKILYAQMQHITYDEFLSVVLGKLSSEKFGIISQPNGTKDTYNATLDPSIANHFASSAFRFAHTLLPRLFNITRDNSSPEAIAMHQMLFNPYSLYTKNGLDKALDSAINTPLERADPYFNDELKTKLFIKIDTDEEEFKNLTYKGKVLKPCGLDLVSLNIQRGRDHGLPSYPEFRKYCKLPETDTWEQMEKAVDQASLQRMKKLYGVPQNVDVYTGALSEPPMDGGILGPLFTCLIADQFMRLKYGDSFWYERKIGPQRFTKPQLDQIYGTMLSSIICRNSDQVTFIQRYAMKRSSSENLLEDCRTLDTFDYTPWKENPGQQGNGYYHVKTNHEQSYVTVMHGNRTTVGIENLVGNVTVAPIVQGQEEKDVEEITAATAGVSTSNMSEEVAENETNSTTMKSPEMT